MEMKEKRRPAGRRALLGVCALVLPASGGCGGAGDRDQQEQLGDRDQSSAYALLVGIDDYPGWRHDLNGPVEDVRLMTDVLTSRFGFPASNVMILTDSAATRVNIANGIVQHLGQAGPDGVAVFFYSGHGTRIGANVAVTGPADPEPGGDGDEALVVYARDRRSSILLDEELGFLIESLDAGRSMVVVDACFSGEITRGPSGSPRSKLIPSDDDEFAASLSMPTEFIAAELKSSGAIPDLSAGFGDMDAVREVLMRPQRHIMWGSSTEEQVSWTTGEGSSLFTHYAAQHLSSAPLSSTLAEVGQSVFQDVEWYVQDHGNISAQHPQLRRHDETMTLGDFFLVR